MNMKPIARSAAVLGLLCATACGGAGGGIAEWRTGGQNEGQMYRYVDVSIVEPLTQRVYVGVEQDDPVLYPAGPIDIGEVDGNTFTATLVYNYDLAPGSYSGKIRLLLCGDQYCHRRHVLTGNEISYTVTVAAGIGLTAFINGAPATVEPVDMSPGAMVVHSAAGDRVRLVFSEDVDITPSGMRASATDVSMDDTSWEGTVACQPDLPIFPTGTLWFDVRSRTGPPALMDLRVGVRP
jgi:hypothetical protein